MAHALNFPSGGYIVALQYFCNIIFAFLQHVPSTLRLNGTPLIKKHRVTKTGPHDAGSQPTSFDPKKRHVTNTRPQPTSFDPTKSHITNTGPQDLGSQSTSFDPKNVTSRKWGPNRPFRCLDTWKPYFGLVLDLWQRAPTNWWMSDKTIIRPGSNPKK